jgi:Carboxypeptidase regulatory-like domain
MSRHFLKLAAAAVLAAGAAGAQGVGTVQGRVSDAASGRPLPDVQVVVVDTRLGAVTNAQGEFTIAAVPVGARSVTARRLGFQPATRAITVTAGGAVRVEFALDASALNLSEVVVRRASSSHSMRALST